MERYSYGRDIPSEPLSFESMAADGKGILRGGFSLIFSLAAETSMAGKTNTNCKGANCGNCTICPPKVV